MKYSFLGKLLAVGIAVAKRLLVPTHINLLSRNEAYKLVDLQMEGAPGIHTVGILGITVGIKYEAAPVDSQGDLPPGG